MGLARRPLACAIWRSPGGDLVTLLHLSESFIMTMTASHPWPHPIRVWHAAGAQPTGLRVTGPERAPPWGWGHLGRSHPKCTQP